MSEALIDLDALQSEYKNRVEAWIAAIREEEDLVSVAQNVAEIDLWEAAGFREDEIRQQVKSAKKHYEDALRVAHFDF